MPINDDHRSVYELQYDKMTSLSFHQSIKPLNDVLRDLLAQFFKAFIAVTVSLSDPFLPKIIKLSYNYTLFKM